MMGWMMIIDQILNIYASPTPNQSTLRSHAPEEAAEADVGGEHGAGKHEEGIDGHDMLQHLAPRQVVPAPHRAQPVAHLRFDRCG